MKKLLILAVLFIFPLSMLFAHSASEIKTSYDVKTQILTVNIKHVISSSKNSNPNEHYIKEVTVAVNGEELVKKSFTSQTGDSVMTTFKIEAKRGDSITVTATCNQPATSVSEIKVR